MFSPCVVAYEHINKITQYIHALLTSKTHSKINNQWQDSKQRDGYITFAAAVGCIEQRWGHALADAQNYSFFHHELVQKECAPGRIL